MGKELVSTIGFVSIIVLDVHSKLLRLLHLGDQHFTKNVVGQCRKVLHNVVPVALKQRNLLVAISDPLHVAQVSDTVYRGHLLVESEAALNHMCHLPSRNKLLVFDHARQHDSEFSLEISTLDFAL